VSLKDACKAHSTVLQHKSAVCETIKSAGGRDISADRTIQRLLKGFAKIAPPKTNSMPRWDLTLVLRALCAPPFEPLNEASTKYITLKTAFLIAWGTAARVSEVHALCMDSDHLQWGKDGKFLRLMAHSDFMAKNQRSNEPPRLYKLTALKHRVPSGGDQLLCPVRAVRLYLQHTESYRGDKTRLFLSMVHGRKTEVGKQTISRWIRETIKTCYELAAPQIRDETEGCHAHELRALGSSLLAVRHKPVQDIMKAAYWKSENCFTTYYLKDMAKYEMAGKQGLTTSILGTELEL
jgi:integrase